MKKILLLGGSAQQVIAIETAKHLGIYTVLCDYLPDNPGQFHADKFYQKSTTDKEEMLRIALEESIDYIISLTHMIRQLPQRHTWLRKWDCLQILTKQSRHFVIKICFGNFFLLMALILQEQKDLRLKKMQ